MLIVVGGHSRNVGKTSVVAGIIAALPEYHWTALKITQYGHGVCSDHGSDCGCADPVHPFAIDEERERGSGTDTSRFLDAGARRVYWVRTPMGQLGAAMPGVRRILDAAPHAICESNSLLQFIRPDLYIVVLDFAVEDFKPTSLRYLDRADLLLIHEGEGHAAGWAQVSAKLWARKPSLAIHPPDYVPGELTARIEKQLAGAV